jgi:hypothetical protein
VDDDWHRLMQLRDLDDVAQGDEAAPPPRLPEQAVVADRHDGRAERPTRDDVRQDGMTR